MGYSGAGGKLIDEKNQKQKISWHCPFKNDNWFSLLKDDADDDGVMKMMMIPCPWELIHQKGMPIQIQANGPTCCFSEQLLEN